MGMTQKTAVLDTLKRKGDITSLEAFSSLGITRLSDVIFKLRKMGYNIETRTEVTKNRYGNTTNYARYILVEDEV